jgi:hypothetical protein
MRTFYLVHGRLRGLVEPEFIVRVIVEIDTPTLSSSAIARERLENFIFVVVIVRLGIIDSFLDLARRT